MHTVWLFSPISKLKSYCLIITFAHFFYCKHTALLFSTLSQVKAHFLIILPTFSIIITLSHFSAHFLNCEHPIFIIQKSYWIKGTPPYYYAHILKKYIFVQTFSFLSTLSYHLAQSLELKPLSSIQIKNNPYSILLSPYFVRHQRWSRRRRSPTGSPLDPIGTITTTLQSQKARPLQKMR